MQSDSGSAGHVSTAKSPSAANGRFGQHVICTWSKDQIVIMMGSGEAEMYAACMAIKQDVSTPWNFKWATARLSAAVVDLECMKDLVFSPCST